MEERIFFESDGLRLEGLLHRGGTGRGVVVTHPHPLYGGDMENVVVAIIADKYQKAGFSTLRFNFRGVGKSDGAYADGLGEARDVTAAGRYLQQADCPTLHLAGYSFGTWVNASPECDRSLFTDMIMVSPPAAFMDFGKIEPIGILSLVVTGRHDDLAPPMEIQAMVPIWNPSAKFEIIEGADHFFSGGFSQLGKVLSSHVS